LGILVAVVRGAIAELRVFAKACIPAAQVLDAGQRGRVDAMGVLLIAMPALGSQAAHQ